MIIAWKEIKESKGRYILICAVILLVSYLSFFLTALSFGLAQANRTSVDAWNARSVILSDDANGVVVSSSITREQEKNAMGSSHNSDPGTAGTNSVEPISVLPAVTSISQDAQSTTGIGKDFNAVLFGVRDNSTLVPPLVEGRQAKGASEAVASISLKTKDSVNLGDTIKAGKANDEYTIVGFTRSSEYNTSPVVYVRNGSFTLPAALAAQAGLAAQVTRDSGGQKTAVDEGRDIVASALVVTSRSSTGTATALPDGLVNVDIKDFINSIPGYQAQVLTFVLMLGFLVGISALIVGIFIYILTIHKRHIFGVLKAQGYSNGFIARSVLFQTLLLAVAGTVWGLGLALLTVSAMPPRVPVSVSVYWYSLIGGILILSCLLGAVFSIIAVTSVDALEALS